LYIQPVKYTFELKLRERGKRGPCPQTVYSH
ncbi:unnamed protein product, partial [marine sediment metagenome]